MASFYNHYYHNYKPYFPAPRIPYHKEKNKPISSNYQEEMSNSYNKANSSTTQENEESRTCTKTKEKEQTPRNFTIGPISFKNPFFYDIETPIFEVFGIQLYLDDIIILGLLFFLYQEGVQDEMLYIALILLLISWKNHSYQ